MKRHILLVLWSAGLCLAAEPVKLPLDLGTLKAGGKTYEGVKVTGMDAVGIKIMHDGGTARIIYDMLPDDVAALFPSDLEAAKAQKQKEAAELAAHEIEMERAAVANQKEAAVKLAAGETEGAEDEAPPEGDVEGKPKLDGKSKAERIAGLRAYIARLEAGKAKTKAYIARRTIRTYKMMEGGIRNYVTKDSDGRGYVYQDVNSTRKGLAVHIQEHLNEEQEKVTQAIVLIREANEEIRSLQEEE